jgi:hypothetical protein
MKLPPYNPPKAFSETQICKTELRSRITEAVNETLVKHCTVREIESMMDALDGVRSDLASIALQIKRSERGENRHFESERSNSLKEPLLGMINKLADDIKKNGNHSPLVVKKGMKNGKRRQSNR